MERELPQEAKIKWYAYGLASGMYNRDKTPYPDEGSYL